MQSTVQHGGGGRGGGGISGGSMSEEISVVMSSVESSAYPDESDLELGLGLSLGCGGGKAKKRPQAPAEEAAGGGSWDQYARILTAKDFASVVSAKTSSSLSSSSSSSAIKGSNTNSSCGTKRTAEPPSSPPGRSAASQFVGWPPIRTYRMNNLTNHAKSPVTENFFSTIDACKTKNTVADKTNRSNNANNVPKEKGLLKTSLFVKVNMDGIPIGRKVDLSAHSCYETLTQALDDMFLPNVAIGGTLSRVDEQIVTGVRKPERLLDGSSDYVLTYEDKDGDWMLVGDVPWNLFLNSVRRLRIMRTTEANGLAPGLHTRSSKH